MRYLEIPLRDDGTAQLDAYVLDPAIRHRQYKTRPAIIVCPGGAYLTLATKEAEPVAARFLGMGFQVFVLRYKHYVLKRQGEEGPDPVVDPGSRIPEQLVDLMTSMRIVHEHAAEWDINESRVYAIGFSAGGHLVGSLAERFDDAELLARAGATAEQTKPAGVIMGYPMISAGPMQRQLAEMPEPMRETARLISRGLFGTDAPSDEQVASIDLTRLVRPDMPRLFVWQPGEDSVVTPAETLAFVGAAYAAGVPCELHFYEHGPHGTSLCDTTSASAPEDVIPANAAWVRAAERWLAADDPQPELYHE